MGQVPADLVVVGAGIVGCLIAREAVRRRPGTSVIVLDRDAIGSGATRRSAGLHFPRGASARVRRMAAGSQDFYAQLLRERPGLPIHPVDAYVVAAETAPRLPEVYLPTAALARTDAVPGQSIRVPARAGVWHCQGCHYADVPALTLAIARALRPQVTFGEGLRVTAIAPGDEKVELRLSSGDTLIAGRVALAPGPWLADPAWRTLLAPARARVKRVVALHLEGGVSRQDPAIVFQDEDAFLLPLRSRGHWLFSYTCQEWGVSPNDPVAGLSRRHLAEAGETLRRYAPVLADRLSAGRVFCDAYSDDGEPQVRALDDAGRVVFAGAANGSGYRLAPAIAAAAVDLLSPASSRRPA
ncbi:NAD(P)/FAD-dependent oxidoreductase [Amycolatopsis anabasis]|uniref:NAD(P)/FAD-dependent oxidoreductase n=1 Tax=Amycolatopsis anabasis TaxID=1840409 RepID=UPI00131D3E2E|nr:FAD-dependent oxidoreductase [Amycolatopsis anabasis]